MTTFLLSEELFFPPPGLANPDGLLAIGGDLSEERLIMAYQMGIFPWYSEGDPVLWWSPDPRLILLPEEFHVSRSLKKVIAQKQFQITFDTAFQNVVTGCSGRRPKSRGTWIVPEMAAAYQRLHESGIAHSVEAWQGETLVGGLYGVSLGGSFFGESMFSHVPNASKVAMWALVSHVKKKGFDLVDCQVTSEHLLRLGAKELPRKTFLAMLKRAMQKPTLTGKWKPEI